MQIEDGKERLVRYFSDGGWDLYDGFATQKNNELSISDIVLPVTLDSRLDTIFSMKYGTLLRQRQTSNEISRCH